MPDDPNATLDDLLGRGNGAGTARLATSAHPAGVDEPAAAAPDVDDALVDESDFTGPPRRRSRLTTALVVILIFLLGVLVGTQAGSLAAHGGPPGGGRPGASSARR